MSITLYDSDLLSAMTASLVEHDENGNEFEWMGTCEHLDGIAVKDLLEAQRRAISGSTSGGGGYVPISGGTMDIAPESSDSYSEWENIVHN